MKSILNPYVSFKDNAKEAMEFYHGIFGGELTMSTFKEGGMSNDPAIDNNIMHAMLVTESDFKLMASDTPPGMEYTPGANISISLSGDDDAELRGYWEALVEGGTVILPFEMAPWGDFFGMLTDKFGISWMVNISPKK